MSILAKLTQAPARRRPKPAARPPDGLHAYRTQAAQLMAGARASGLRLERQWVISFVVVVAMLALLAGLYLNVTASASIAGRQIQNIEVETVANEQINADLETRIAMLMSNSVLEQRAEAMGFQPVDRAGLEYVVVPGYFPPQPVSMVSSTAPAESLADSPEFKETLIEWFSKQIEAVSLPLSQAKH